MGIVAEWDVAGDRVDPCNALRATLSGFDAISSFGADGARRAHFSGTSTHDDERCEQSASDDADFPPGRAWLPSGLTFHSPQPSDEP